MAKGKAKTSNSRVDLAPPQPRSLRSRKRECPSDEISETDDIQATHHHRDTEGNNTTVDATLLQCHQPPLQESTVISTQQHEAEKQSSLTKQDPDTGGKQEEATNVMVKAFEEQEETTVTNANNDSLLEGFTVHADDDANKNGKDKKEMTAEEYNRPPPQTCPYQLQVSLQVFEEGDGTALEEKLGVPAKKKRRMGMCGLTEKERSHFLQINKRENGLNGPETAEKQICNNTADLVAQEEIISSPPLSSSLSIPVSTMQNEAESSHCGGDDRAETEVHIAVTTSDGTGAVCDPGCSKGKSSEVEGVTVRGPKQTGDTESEPPAEEEEDGLLGNQEQQEVEGGTVEIVSEKPLEQMKDGEDGSVVDQSLTINFYSNLTQSEETVNRDAVEAALLQVNGVTRTRDEKKEELTGDAGDGAEAGASSTDTRSGGFNTVDLREAAAAPGGSERDCCDSDDGPGAGPSTMNAEPSQTKDTTDPFGSGYLDYVSDSQLNTIVLTEEEVMEREEDLHEDATDLICGLIRELSSLNRKVMATHRELENLRRGSKSSRSSIR